MKCDCVNRHLAPKQPFLIPLLCSQVQPTDPNNCGRQAICVVSAEVRCGKNQCRPWIRGKSVNLNQSNFALSTPGRQVQKVGNWHFTGHFGGRAKKSRVKAMSKHEMMLTRNVATYLLAKTLTALLFQIRYKV